MDEQRIVPRFPLPKEKIKFLFEGCEKVFAVRDISERGLGISLLEFSESVLFPMGYACEAELRVGEATLRVPVRVSRVSAWSIGFTFEGLSEEIQEKIQDIVSPLRVGGSLKLVDFRAAPEAFLHGMTAWYHGDSGADLFLWGDKQGGIQRAMFCIGRQYWEWDGVQGAATGELQRLEGDKVVLHKDATPNPRLRERFRKILEHAAVLDYRLVSFLKEKT
jgi:hypothetical protein